jgi:hypothetical protein
MKSTTLGIAAGLALGLTASGFAQELSAEQRFTDTVVGFESKGTYHNVTLTIAGPDGFHARAYARGGVPKIDLREFGTVEDGQYTWQLTGATDEATKKRTPVEDGRPTQARPPLKGVTASGAFLVRNGMIVKREPASDKRDRQ